MSTSFIVLLIWRVDNSLCWQREKGQIVPSFFDAVGKFFNELVGEKDEDVTPLHRAAMDGDLVAVRRLVGEGAEVDARTATTWGAMTPICKAVIAGHTEVVAALIDAGANVESGDGQGMTPLMYAACRRKCDLVKLLLDHGAMVNACLDEYDAFDYACREADREIVNLLAERGAIVERIKSDGATRLHCSVAVELLLEGSHCLNQVNLRDRDGDTPLLKAIRNAEPGAVASLVRHGASIIEPDSKGNLPFNVIIQQYTHQCNDALHERLLKCAKLLFAEGGDVNRADGQGVFPLHHAAGVCAIDLLTWLLESGANVNATIEGQRPLAWCGVFVDDMDKERIRQARAVIRKYSDVNMP